MKRRLLILGLFLLLVAGGAIVNVAVAWVMPRYGVMRTVANGYPAGIEPLDRSSPLIGVLADDASLISFGRQNSYGWAYDREVIYSHNGVTNRSIMRGWCGWPMRSLGGEYVTGIGLRNAIDVPELPLWPRPFPYNGLTFLPTGVLWPGFAVDTLLYTGVLWLLIRGPFALRHRRRIKRGQCPACAYPVGTSPVCTECGKPVTAGKA